MASSPLRIRLSRELNLHLIGHDLRQRRGNFKAQRGIKRFCLQFGEGQQAG